MAAASEYQGRLAGLKLRLEGGEADRADIMQAVAEGWLKPAERDQALSLWNRRRAEIRQRDSDIGRVAAVFAGEREPLDPANPDDRRALDVHYTDTKAAWLSAGLTEDQLGPVVADYLGVAKWVPSELRRDVASVFRDGTPERRLSIAGLLGLLLERIFEWVGDPWGGRAATLDDIFKPAASSSLGLWPPDDPDPGFKWPRWPGHPPVLGPVPMPKPDIDELPILRFDPPNSPMIRRPSILEGFDPRDVAEGLLINALIDSGWPRQNAPDRAAAILSGTLDPNDRFAASDRQGFQRFVDNLVDDGRLNPSQRARFINVVAMGASMPDSAPPTSNAAAPSAYSVDIDVDGPRPVQDINDDTASPRQETKQDSNEHVDDDDDDGTDEDEVLQVASFDDPLSRSIGGVLGIGSTPEQLQKGAKDWVDLIDGNISLEEMRDTQGRFQFGRYALNEETVSLLDKALQAEPDELRTLGREIQDSNLTADQKYVLKTLVRKVSSGGIDYRDPDEIDAILRRLDEGLARKWEDVANSGALSGKGARGRSPAVRSREGDSAAPQTGSARQQAVVARPPRPPEVSRTIDPLTKDEFEKLPSQGLVDPNRIRTSQNKYSETFKEEDGAGPRRAVSQLIEELRAGKDTSKVDPIRIFEKDGKVYALDHRRLIAARAAGTEVHFRKASPTEVEKDYVNKFTTRDDGMPIALGAGRRREGK